MDTATQALELDSSAIAKTKSQISALVSEIAALAQSHRDPLSFAQAMLPRLVNSMAAHGAALWSVSSQGEWEAVHCFGVPTELIADNAPESLRSVEAKIEKSFDSLQALLDIPNPSNDTTVQNSNSKNAALPFGEPNNSTRRTHPSPIHRLLLTKVQQERQPVLVPPGSRNANLDPLNPLPTSAPPASVSQPINPTAMALIYAPVPVESNLGTWWIQVIQPPSGGVATQRGYLRFVAQIADLTADFLKTHRLREYEHQTRITQATARLLDCAANPEGQPRSGELLSNTIARVRDILECDQVFLVERSNARKPWKILVASGMRATNPQSDGSQSISQTIDWFLGQASIHHHKQAPIFVLAQDRRLAASNPDASPTITLRLASGITSSDPPVPRAAEPRDEGILRFNTIFSAAVTSWMPLFTGATTQSTGLGLLAYWSWPTSRPSESHLAELLLDSQRTCTVVIKATRPPELALWTGRPGTGTRRTKHHFLSIMRSRAAVTTLILSAVGAVGFISVPVHLTAPATIIAAKQTRHYANSDAIVRGVHVDYGQRVVPGQLLLELEDKNLERLLEQTKAEVRQNEQKQRSISTRLLRDQQLPEPARHALEGELDGLRKIAPQTAIRLNDLQTQFDSLRVRSHSAGVVTTWNASQSLRDRPVRTGQLLVSVQANDTPWIVEARLPQHQAGEFLALATEQAKSQIPFDAVCSLVSQPLRDIPAIFRPEDEASIVAIGADSIQDSVFRIRFSIPPIQDVAVTSGSAATLRIKAGDSPLWKAIFWHAINGAWTKWRLWTGL